MNTAATFMLISLLCTSCGVRDVLGPGDKPDFQNKDWTAITLNYGVNTRATNGIKRAFTVIDPATITSLKAKMAVKEIKGRSSGTRDQLRFVERTGASWHGNIVSRTRIELSSTEEGWRSYYIEFQDGTFVDALLDLCVTSERTFHAKAKPENILFVQQFLVEPWPEAPPESARMRKKMLEAYPPVEE
jgi:hypothetical protein